MRHVLVVGPLDELDAAAVPSLELLRADSADDAIDRLARASRIDLVVVGTGVGSGIEIARRIREEVPGNLPIAVVGEVGPAPPGLEIELWPRAEVASRWRNLLTEAD